MKQVLFAKDNFFFVAMAHSLPLNHYDVVAEFPDDISNDDIFCQTQNVESHWRPDKPCRSMSVGDLIRDTNTGKIIRCAGAGWEDYVEVKPDLAGWHQAGYQG